MEPISYDYLVLGLGAESFFGVEGAPDHAFPLYTLRDAVRLKEHILERWRPPTRTRSSSTTARSTSSSWAAAQRVSRARDR